MGGPGDESDVLDIRKLPGFGPDWRRDIAGVWYGGDMVFRPVFKHLDTERGLSSVQLAWHCEWLENDGAGCAINRGLHFGLPEAPVECGPPLQLPPYTGIGMAVVVGPETNDWEPSTLEQRALAHMWARVLRHLYNPADYELCLIPSWVAEQHSEDLTPFSPEATAAALGHFERDCGCRKVALFQAADYRIDDPQLLPWGYISCPYERLEDTFAQGGGAGATGFITQRGRSDQVTNWARLVSPTVRLDAQLDACLLMFEVLWHGEALAILSRQADPDDIGGACKAEDVVALVRRLRPRKSEAEESSTLDEASAPWLADTDD